MWRRKIKDDLKRLRAFADRIVLDIDNYEMYVPKVRKHVRKAYIHLEKAEKELERI